MKNKKTIIILIILIIISLLYYKFYQVENYNIYNTTDTKIESIIDNHMIQCKNKNSKEGLKNVYFTEYDNKSGFTELVKTSIENDGQDYNSYNITEKIKINNNIYLIKMIVNINDPISLEEIKQPYNFYMCNINNNFKIVFSKERIPERLYSKNDDLLELYTDKELNSEIAEEFHKQGKK